MTTEVSALVKHKFAKVQREVAIISEYCHFEIKICPFKWRFGQVEYFNWSHQLPYLRSCQRGGGGVSALFFFSFKVTSCSREILVRLGITFVSLWDDFRVAFGLLWGRFGMTFGSLWDDFRVALGWLWDNFGMTLGSLWDDFRVTLGWLWGHFGMTLRSP